MQQEEIIKLKQKINRLESENQKLLTQKKDLEAQNNYFLNQFNGITLLLAKNGNIKKIQNPDKFKQFFQVSSTENINLTTLFTPENNQRFQNILATATNEIQKKLLICKHNKQQQFLELHIKKTNQDTYQLSIFDKTKKYEKETQLKLYDYAVNHSPATVLITDKNGNILFVNDHFKQTTGYTQTDVQNKTPRVLKSGVQHKDFYKKLWETLNQGQEWKGEFCNKKKNGELFWELASISPIQNEQNETTHFIAIKLDITERIEQESQLKKALIAAEEADKLKSAFLANISHEVRTPLNSIMGFSEILKNPKLTEEKRIKYSNIILKNSQTLLERINNIVDVSKIEAGQLKLELTECPVLSILEDIEYYIKNKLTEENKNSIKVFIENENITDNQMIITDSIRLKQVLKHLVDNAIKFTNAGKINVKLEQKDQTFVFSISDTGIGIAQDQQDKIFNYFVQANNTDKRVHSGTGLGLSISKKIIRLMGGKIWFTSAETTGSTFCFSIPIINTTNKGHYQNLLKKIENKHIVIVDENPANLLYLSKLLQPYNLTIETYTTLTDLMKNQIKKTQIDLFIIDVYYKKENCFHILSTLKKNYPNTLVFLQTAYDINENILNENKAYFDVLVKKPINTTQLFKLLYSNLK